MKRSVEHGEAGNKRAGKQGTRDLGNEGTERRGLGAKGLRDCPRRLTPLTALPPLTSLISSRHRASNGTGLDSRGRTPAKMDAGWWVL